MARFTATLTCRHTTPVVKRNAKAVFCERCKQMRGVRSVGMSCGKSPSSTGGGTVDTPG